MPAGASSVRVGREAHESIAHRYDDNTAKKRAPRALEVWPYCAMRKRPMQPERAQSTNLFICEGTPRLLARRFWWTRARLFLILDCSILLTVTSGCGSSPVPLSPPAKPFP